jgi:hypothetical protein
VWIGLPKEVFSRIVGFVTPSETDSPRPATGGAAPAASSLESRGLAGPLLHLSGAKGVRELLMAERGRVGKDWQGKSFEREFSLCEH